LRSAYTKETEILATCIGNMTYEADGLDSTLANYRLIPISDVYAINGRTLTRCVLEPPVIRQRSA
jgi:hypothetical protein